MSSANSIIKGVILGMRPKHWAKNLFVFLPLLFGEKLFKYPVNLKTVGVFFAFSLAASATYLLNDVLDAAADRLHPQKRLRPVASGMITGGTAILFAVVLAVIAAGLALALDTKVGLVVLGYIVLSMIYSGFLKHSVILDVFCIGAFFFLRILAGSTIAGLQMSHWIIFMTVLLALFLGFSKRRQELQGSENGNGEQRLVLAHYSLQFIDQITAVLTSCIAVSYMLYTVNERTVGEFGTDHLIYTIPFVFYGIFRYLYLIHQHGEGEDPTAVLFSDSRMQINLVLWAAVCIAVIYYGL